MSSLYQLQSCNAVERENFSSNFKFLCVHCVSFQRNDRKFIMDYLEVMTNLYDAQQETNVAMPCYRAKDSDLR